LRKDKEEAAKKEVEESTEKEVEAKKNSAEATEKAVEVKKKKQNPKYKSQLKEHPLKVVVLHLIAERDLIDLAEIYLSDEFYPGHVHVNSLVVPKKLPLALAIENKCDQTAAFIARKMNHHRYNFNIQNQPYHAMN